MYDCSQFTPIIASTIGGCLSGVVGFIFARKLDKQRVINAAKSSVVIVRAEIKQGGTSIHDFHTRSIPVLQEAVTKAIPYLSKKQQNIVANGWSAYRLMNTHSMTPFAGTAAICRGRGWPANTPEEAIEALLGHIEDELR